jgi:hypothetical protein
MCAFVLATTTLESAGFGSERLGRPDLYVLPGVVFGIAVIAVAVTLMYSHLAQYVRLGSAAPTEETGFHRNQVRRRLLTTGLLGVLGLAMIVGVFLKGDWFIGWWMVVLVVCGVLCLSAAMDLFWTRQHYYRIRQKQQAEIAMLRADLEALRGKVKSGPEEEASE